MGAKFDQWLAKSTTLHFLRGLLKLEDIHARSTYRCWRQTLTRCASQQARTFHTTQRWQQSRQFRKVYETPEGEQQIKKATKQLDVELLSFQLSVLGLITSNTSTQTYDTFPEARRQADVNSKHGFRKLLVDDHTHRDNPILWAEVLQFRHRIDGIDGIEDVWRGMRKRKFDLPTKGEEADILWATLILGTINVKRNTSVRFWTFLAEIFNYAVELKQRTGEHYDGLYKCVVGGLLRSNFDAFARNVQAWSRKLFDAGLMTREDVARIVEDALLSPQRNQALRSFKMIYFTSDYRDLYDACMSEALKLDDEAGALRLHQIFLEKNDEPSAEMLAKPGVQRLFDLDKNKALPIRRPGEAGAAPNSTSLGTAVGDTHAIRPKTLSDHFCARLVATRAFSLSFVIQSLSILGIERLGPLAVREIVLRAGSLAEFQDKLKDIEARGMRINDDAYCQLVSEVVEDEIASLWDVLLASDQHPESYADVETQKALLRVFLKEHRWAEAHLSLLALSLSGAQGPMEGWNVLLQHYVTSYEDRPMISAFQSVQSQGLHLTWKSVDDIYRHALPERQAAKRYIKGRGPQWFDPLDFSINAIMYASEQGTHISFSKWIELLKRVGMNHDWEKVERLVLWLVDHYSFHRSASLLGLGEDAELHRARVERRTNELRKIFNPLMREALLVWGFRSASVRHQLTIQWPKKSDTEEQDDTKSRIEPWAKGLALLKTLNSIDPGFSIKEAKKAFKLRMWILFGPAYSVVGLNNEARRMNKLSLAHYIKQAEEVWPGMAHDIDPAFLEEKEDTDPRPLLLAFFREFRRANKHRNEYVDVKAWLQQPPTAIESNETIERRSIPAKQAEWRRDGARMRRNLSKGQAHRLLTRKFYPNPLPPAHR